LEQDYGDVRPVKFFGREGYMKSSAVRAQIENIGILPSVRVTSAQIAKFAAETVIAAGIPVVEIT